MDNQSKHIDFDASPFPGVTAKDSIELPVVPFPGESKRAPTAVVTSFDKDVEAVLADRVIRRRGVPPYTEYFVKWKGLPESVSLIDALRPLGDVGHGSI